MLIDLKPIVVLLNDGKFKGAKLDKFSDKPHDGGKVKEWYKNKQYDEIEKYIGDETNAFLDFYKKIKENIHKLIEDGE